MPYIGVVVLARGWAGNTKNQLRDWATDKKGQAGDEEELQGAAAWCGGVRQVNLHEEPPGGPHLRLLRQGEAGRCAGGCPVSTRWLLQVIVSNLVITVYLILCQMEHRKVDQSCNHHDRNTATVLRVARGFWLWQNNSINTCLPVRRKRLK